MLDRFVFVKLLQDEIVCVFSMMSLAVVVNALRIELRTSGYFMCAQGSLTKHAEETLDASQ